MENALYNLTNQTLFYLLWLYLQLPNRSKLNENMDTNTL
jgi:hypothetical protein